MATAIADGLNPAFSPDLRRIALAGIAAGGLDFIYFSAKSLLHGSTPDKVFRAIARFWPLDGVTTNDAVRTVIGVATHFGLATIMAAGFALLVPTSKIMQKAIWPAGAAYGLALYLVMYLLVMPLRWPEIYPKFEGVSSVLDILVHVAIGLLFAAMLGRPTVQLPQS